MTERFGNRRRFLIDSSAATLAGAAIAARGAAEEEKGEKIRVAVVGTGGRGSDLTRNLTTIDRAEIVAVCDDYPPHLSRGQQYAGPGAQAFANLTRMLRETRPQALVVATPLYLHYEMCLEAIDAGCAVFCEKTMCHSIEQARKLADEVSRRGIVFQVGLQRRANAIYRQAAAMAQTGMLGRITAIKCQWHRNDNWRRPVPVARDDAQWPALERRLNWRLYWEFSQGLMAELASHQMDVANWILGRPPRNVIASGGVDYWRDGREVFDNVFCTYEYEMPGETALSDAAGGEPYVVRATYSSVQNNAFEGASELIMGTKGTLFLTQKKGLFYRESAAEDPGWSHEGRVAQNASVITSGKTLKMENDPWAHRDKPYEIDSEGDDTRDELVAFLESVAHNDPKTICDVQNGLINAATVLIGNQAMKEQQAVEFPNDVNERVAAHESAN